MKKLKDMITRMYFYDADGNQYPQDMTLVEMAEKADLDYDKRVVAKTQFPHGEVSTVSLWVSSSGLPFETMWFPTNDEGPELFARYRTRHEAIDGHQAAVKKYGDAK